MKTENVNRILEALDYEMRRVGFKDWDDAMDFAKETFNAPDGALSFGRIYSRAEIAKEYSSTPEPTRAELQQEIKQIKGMAGNFRRLFIQSIKAEIPHDRGGRDSEKVRGSLKEQQQRIREVTSLTAGGAGTTVAIKRVAQRHGISESSMWRIWANRKVDEDSDDE